MCGIAGFTQLDGRPLDRPLLIRMARRLRHRGPDGAGVEILGNVGFAHRRLAIIDLRGGRQPMGDSSGSVWVTFNGEIYNYLELRKSLTMEGARFATHSDTETIIHVYLRFGTIGFAKLRGMFAFALYDKRCNTVMLVRDRFGIKPLYYYLDSHVLIFASELKALLEHPRVPREVDPLAIGDFLTYLYVPGNRCILKGVEKVPPATIVSVQNGKASAKRYWQLPVETRSHDGKSEEEWTEQLRLLLDESVRLHMRSDVAYAALLSGGIDSSVVAALMARHSTRPIRTYCVGFEEAQFNELPHARRVAQHLGAYHHEIILRPEGIGILPQIVSQFDEPFADSSALPCFYVAKAVAEDVKVCLSGDGGDELFGGYDVYRVALRLARLEVIPGWLRRLLCRATTRFYPRWIPGLGLLRCTGLEWNERYGELMCAFNTDEKKNVLAGDFRRTLETAGPYEYLRNIIANVNCLGRLEQMQYVDFHTYLPDDILVKVDRTSMFHSLEVRVPLIDHVVVEGTVRLPTDLKVRGKVGKYILRRIAATLLPPDIASRPKQGFAIPLKRWLGGELSDLADEVLTDRRTTQRGIFNVPALMTIVRENRWGWRDLSGEVWSAIMLELWCREYLDSR